MANTAFIGLGTTLSTNFYIRNFYRKNISAQSGDTRPTMSKAELSFADSVALRRAVKKLGSFEYDEDHDTDIRNSVLAYLKTYNNTLSSVSESDDQSLQRFSKQLKKLSQDHADELDKIGITVNSDGSLTSRESLFKTASLKKFKSIFSRDSDFMQRSSALSKRISRRSEVVDLSEKRKKLNETAAKSAAGAQPDAPVTAAALPAEVPQLDASAMTGVGGAVDISL